MSLYHQFQTALTFGNFIPFLRIHVSKLSKNSNNSKYIILIIIEINSNYYVYETNFTDRKRDVIPDVIIP